jgi:periplasmic protein TonB
VSPAGSGLSRLEERLKATGELHVSLLHRGEGRVLLGALVAAAAVHVAAALLPLPPSTGSGERRAVSRAARRPVVAQAIVPSLPAPPPPRRPPVREAPVAVKPSPVAVAIPPAAVPLPDLLEPMVEPEPEMVPGELPRDVEIVLGTPEPPPTGPLLKQAGITSDPELLPESKVQPLYPPRALEHRIRGNVVLDVSVLPDGTIGDIAVLRCTPPDAGFCQSAVKAVKRWRYRPAYQDGRPVQVSITVKVDFIP